jgi:branched-chain amino acid transport system ATP-binding protein
MLLEVDKINTYYGISHILFDVSIQVAPGEVVCILGRNGVGKTTLIRSIMGLTAPRSGRLVFNGVSIIGKRPFQIARKGIGFVPEDRIIFPDLTVKENLEMGFKKGQKGPWNFGRVYAMFPRLKERQSQMGGTLSGGEQQMLTIARTLLGNPELLAGRAIRGTVPPGSQGTGRAGAPFEGRGDDHPAFRAKLRLYLEAFRPRVYSGKRAG